MHLTFEALPLTKKYPLRISRGTSYGSTNLLVLVHQDGLTGVGECAPGTGDSDDKFASEAQSALEIHQMGICELESPFLVWQFLKDAGLKGAVMAGVDIALWDLIGKRAGLPLHVILGLPLPTAPSTVTIGINPVDVIRERVPEILTRTQAKALKIKLGSPEGIEADKASYEACRVASQPFNVELQIDANGGWKPEDAGSMITWLSERDCRYVEQPIPAGRETEIGAFFDDRKLPIFLDESICTSADVLKFSRLCDGINLKLMKTGGITEALRLVATARAAGLKTMIGCMGESNIAISAGASIGALFDYIDLDSHLNLNPDPACGATLIDGVVIPSDKPGHGASIRDDADSEVR